MIDISLHSKEIALELLGMPNKQLSNQNELRFGNKGSLSIDLSKGTFYDHENDTGGGMVALIEQERPGANIPDFLRSIGVSDSKMPPVKSNASKIKAKVYTDQEMKRLAKDCELYSRYTDSFCVMRFEGKNYRPFTKTDEGWIMKRPKGLLPLLVSDGDPVLPLLIVEGEKAYQGSTHLYKGVVATWHGGTSSHNKSDWTQLKQREAIIWPDNDKAGFKCAKELKIHLKNIGINTIIAQPPDHFNDKDDLWDAHQRNEQIDIVEYVKEHEFDAGRRVVYQNYGEFKDKDYPEMKWMIEKLFARGHLGMLHGAPGHGKSLITQIMAVCLAAGYDFGHYHIEEPQKVLLIDAEMPPVSLQDRFSKMMLLFDGEIEKEDLIKRVQQNLIIVSHHDQSDEGLIPLNTDDGKEWYYNLINDVDPDFIILDNLLTLMAFEDSNSSEEWSKQVNPLLLRMRREDRSVLFLHHSGKSGKQLGSMAKEVVLDVVIRIELQIDEDDDFGMLSLDTGQYESRFKWTFEKTRHFYGHHAYPVLWKYSNGILTKDKTDKEMRIEVAAELKHSGLSNKEIAAQLKTSERTIRRDLKKATALGLYNENPEF